jgi:hypothetical protein
MTGPCETEAIRRGESPQIQKTARWLDEEIGQIWQTVSMLQDRMGLLEGPKRPELRLLT